MADSLPGILGLQGRPDRVTDYTSGTGTHVRKSALVLARVHVTSGGGGGGGGTNVVSRYAAGGSAAQTVIFWMLLNADLQYVVGAGGTGGSVGSAGSIGGESRFGNIVAAPGNPGIGASATPNHTYGGGYYYDGTVGLILPCGEGLPGGMGGGAPTGYKSYGLSAGFPFPTAGGSGGTAYNISASSPGASNGGVPGADSGSYGGGCGGGSSTYGKGGSGGNANNAGVAVAPTAPSATSYGAGGGGGGCGSGGGAAGANGVGGRIIIEEYIL